METVLLKNKRRDNKDCQNSKSCVQRVQCNFTNSRIENNSYMITLALTKQSRVDRSWLFKFDTDLPINKCHKPNSFAIRNTIVLTISHMKLAIQYMSWLTPLTNWRCFDLVTFSSIRKRTKLAGMKERANMTDIDIRVSLMFCDLKILLNV